jgi:DNA-binding LacI/PurR family transcriptional regulator/ABC-type glycerol-3-phosphate transport system substrate-binding protein
MATIKDVAKRANVSVSTVSLVLNGKKNISEEKYHRINAAIEELKYRPNYIAQNLKKQKAHIIGLVLPETEGHYAQIIKGIDGVLEGDEYFIITKVSQNNIQKENQIFEELLNIGVSGILAVPCEPENVEKYENFVKRGIPIIFIERKVNSHSFSNVIFDNKNIIYFTTTRLLRTYSPEDVLLITGPVKYSSESDCIEGYLEAVDMYYLENQGRNDDYDIDGHKFEVWLQKEYAFNTLFDHFYDMEIKPKCCIVSNYHVAQALHEVFTILGHESEIVSLAENDWMIAAKHYSGIVKQSREAVKLGEKSADLLTRFIKNSMLVENRNIVVSTKKPVETRGYEIPNKVTKKTLRMLLFGSNAMDAMVKLSKGFEKRYGINIDCNTLDYLELKQELLSQVQGSKPDYDIVMMDLPWINSIQKSGFLLDLETMMKGDETFLDHFPQGIKTAFFKKQNGVFGLPIIATIETLFYRRDIFEDKDIKWNFYKKYGFELSPPRTWTEFNYIAEFFDRAVNPSSPVEYGTALCGLKPTVIVEEFLPRQWAFNGKIVDEWGKVCIDSDENYRALESLAKTYEHSPKESLEWFFDEVFKKLLSGEMVMAQGFASHYLPYKYSKLDDTMDRFIDVCIIPGGKPMLGGWMLGINKYSDAHEESYAFLRWATDERLAVHNTLMGGAVPLTAVCNNTLLKNKFPWLRYIDETFSNMGTRETVRDKRGNMIDPDLVDSVLSDNIYKVLLGEASIEEALRTAKETFVRMINNKSGWDMGIVKKL